MSAGEDGPECTTALLFLPATQHWPLNASSFRCTSVMSNLSFFFSFFLRQIMCNGVFPLLSNHCVKSQIASSLPMRAVTFVITSLNNAISAPIAVREQRERTGAASAVR